MTVPSTRTEHTPEQVVQAVRLQHDKYACSALAAVLDVLPALRGAGFAIVRLDGLEERLRKLYNHVEDGSLTAEYAARVAARVVRGETQEADRD